ncbi:hypothetical protein BC962_1156 [Gillisia mitskevichiae]|uniref:Uncharacterized protein n=1 Tax=Gillisia mitskevichiae TaxID=270921 RepID=A0A495Q053_9FLAO|nr:hypothetical protein [Gillisia mitskevichiae]RKS56176.1 hypothetical protein BC962_1156 [Gillisia mitskevichiae]
MRKLTEQLKSEIAESFQFLDNGTTILVDDTVFNPELKKYDLEPEEVRIIVNDVIISTQREIHFSIIYNKYNIEAEEDILNQIYNQNKNVEVTLVKPSKFGDMRKSIYKMIY